MRWILVTSSSFTSTIDNVPPAEPTSPASHSQSLDRQFEVVCNSFGHCLLAHISGIVTQGLHIIWCGVHIAGILLSMEKDAFDCQACIPNAKWRLTMSTTIHEPVANIRANYTMHWIIEVMEIYYMYVIECLVLIHNSYVSMIINLYK